jgi:hypothetical protein
MPRNLRRKSCFAVCNGRAVKTTEQWDKFRSVSARTDAFLNPLDHYFLFEKYE